MATGWSAILGRSQANSNNPPMAKKSSSRIHPTPPPTPPPSWGCFLVGRSRWGAEGATAGWMWVETTTGFARCHWGEHIDGLLPADWRACKEAVEVTDRGRRRWFVGVRWRVAGRRRGPMAAWPALRAGGSARATGDCSRWWASCAADRARRSRRSRRGFSSSRPCCPPEGPGWSDPADGHR